VTCLFAEFDGESLSREQRYAQLRRSVEVHHGQLVRPLAATDGQLAVFARAPDAVAAAASVQVDSRAHCRLAVHTGQADLRDGDYYGPAVARCNRLMALAHSGQVLVSQTTRDLVGGGLPAAFGLRDLGNHRLRDLTPPARIYQLIGPGLLEAFPPLRSMETLPNNLPVLATPFVGREQELGVVCELLRASQVRLLTLTGTGGTGKTRLALQAAADLLDTFEDGVYFVSLAPLADPDLVPSAIARALDLKESGGRSLVQALQESLRDRRVLLVLDNFEHVLAAAPIVVTLLGGAAGLSALVTSRAVLHLYGEHDLPVTPLAVPHEDMKQSAASVARFEAARLFVQRAQAARPDFTLSDANAPLVAELCRRLEGLPLALELAAARLRALTLPALVDRLEYRLPLLTDGPRDTPARQQTLRNTIAWSYDLLATSEQALFRRLSVCRGFTLEAAEALCAPSAGHPRATSVALPPLEIDVLDGITRLVEQSLLQQREAEDGQPWYFMVETIREFAAERLAASGNAPAIQRRHILHELGLVESADPELHGPHQKQWLERLEREHNNIRAAFDACCLAGYAEPAYRIALAVWWFWLVHGHVSEGRERLTRMLDRFPVTLGTDQRAMRRADLRARALYVVSHIANAQGDYAGAGSFQQEALAIRRALGEPIQVAGALEPLGTAAALQGDYATARRAFRESLDIARSLGNPYMIAMSLHDLANVMHEEGDFAAARGLADEALQLLRGVGDKRALGSASFTRAIIAQDEGDYATAQQLAEEALDLQEQSGDSRSIALAHANLGTLATARGDYATARERLAAGLTMFDDLADTDSTASLIDRFAMLEAAQCHHARALRLAGAAAAWRTTSGARLSPAGASKLEAALAPARQTLGDSADDAWRAGQALTLAEAIAEALSYPYPPPAVERPESAQERQPATDLTPREQEVASLIARGLTNRQIGEALVITEGTAASHVVHILDKLGFRSRAQVAVWAAEHGLRYSATL
jgi:predicted ATPase/DNA-binding CsgD family transcriptional regulator